MSHVPTFGEAGANLDRALREHAEMIADHRARLADQQTQLGAHNISVNAMRAEVLERIETCERQVLEAIEEMHKSIRALVRAGANGHG